MKTNFAGRLSLLTIFAAFAFGAACDPKTDITAKPAASPIPSATPSPNATPSASPVVKGGDMTTGAEKLVGRWNGPEGTFLTIAEKTPAANVKNAPKSYTVEIKNLDKSEVFDGTAKGGVIEFSRKGKTETVKPATGIETGMKDLEKETNCVVINKGTEGFCKKQ